MLDALSLRRLLTALASWLDGRQQDAVAYLIEENRILRGHIRGRIRLTDAERRRLAGHGHRLGRRRLQDLSTIVTPDTILRWHRQLIARKWTYVRKRGVRPGVIAEIRCLVICMAAGQWDNTRGRLCIVVTMEPHVRMINSEGLFVDCWRRRTSGSNRGNRGR